MLWDKKCSRRSIVQCVPLLRMTVIWQKRVIEDDAEVNEYEVKLEKKSFEMIALQQPVSARPS